MNPQSLPGRAAWRLAAVFSPGLLIALVLWLYGPFPQPQSYHDFADTRVLLGIPHAGDVLTNIGFLLVGAWGLWFLTRPRLSGKSFVGRREYRLFRWFFLGVFLTAFSSGWYHLEPDNYRLACDRLTMAVAFMSIFAVMISERMNVSLGINLLPLLILIGITSVLYWIWTEHHNQGDLRWYVLVQFYPLITMIAMLLLLPSLYTLGNYYWGMLLFYVAAKVTEALDHEIFNISSGLVSGHNLKHLFAAGGAAWVLRMLWLRQPCSNLHDR